MLLIFLTCYIDAMPYNWAFIVVITWRHFRWCGGASLLPKSAASLFRFLTWCFCCQMQNILYCLVRGFFLPLLIRSLKCSMEELWIVLKILTNGWRLRNFKKNCLLYYSFFSLFKKLLLIFTQQGKHSYSFMLAFLILRLYCFKNNDTINTNSNHNIHRSHLYGTFYGP